ncbi:unnamed protein product, partial [marine sediment metagenome]
SVGDEAGIAPLVVKCPEDVEGCFQLGDITDLW